MNRAAEMTEIFSLLVQRESMLSRSTYQYSSMVENRFNGGKSARTEFAQRLSNCFCAIHARDYGIHGGQTGCILLGCKPLASA